MSSENKNEMEQILRGLEAFLEQEMRDVKTPEGEDQKESAQENLDYEGTDWQDSEPEGFGRESPAQEMSNRQNLEEEDFSQGNLWEKASRPDLEAEVFVQENTAQTFNQQNADSQIPARENTAPKLLARTSSKQSASKRNVPKTVRFEEEMTDWDAPEAADSAPRNSRQNAPKQRASIQKASKQTAQAQTAPMQTVQIQTVPTQTAQAQTAPTQTVQAQTAPMQTAQAQTASKQETESGVVQVQRDKKQASAQKKTSKTARSSGAKKKPQKKRRKKSKLRKFLIAAILIIALLGVGLYQLAGAAYRRMNFKEIASVSELPMQEDGVVNILLIGNDSRENGDDGRSDAMILLSISNRTKTISMTSLLRDMYVEIPGHDGNRLNAAYSYGGAELLMETIEKNFHIPVNRYVLVNFEAFASLVDAVGGIELELTSEEIVYVNGYLVEYNMLTGRPQGTDDMDTSLSGLVHLNGPQALAYSRNRYLGTDFGRTERQRKVLTAVIKKLPKALLANGKGLMDGLLPNLTTNLTQNECFRLSLMAGKLLTYEIASDNIPRPGTYKDVIIRKMEVLEVDFDANVQYLKEKLYGKDADASTAE